MNDADEFGTNGACSPPAYILHLENASKISECATKGEFQFSTTGSGKSTYYGYRYDQTSKLLSEIGNSVSAVNLTFNGKTVEVVPGGIHKIDLNGLKCDVKEKRVEFKVDWGGDGFLQVKNVTPSYCPLVQSSSGGGVGLNLDFGFDFSKTSLQILKTSLDIIKTIKL